MTGSCRRDEVNRNRRALLIGKTQAAGDGGEEPICNRAWLCPGVPSRGESHRRVDASCSLERGRPL